MNKIKETVALLTLCMLMGACSSSKSDEKAKANINALPDSEHIKLEALIEKPELYFGKNLVVEGIIDAQKLKKVNKEISLLSLNIRSVKHKSIKDLDAKPTYEVISINKNLIATSDSVVKSMDRIAYISPANINRFRTLSLDFKVSSSKINATSHYYESAELKNIANEIRMIAKGFNELGDAYGQLVEVGKINMQIEKSTEIVITKEMKESERELLVAGDEFLAAASLKSITFLQVNDAFRFFPVKESINCCSHFKNSTVFNSRVQKCPADMRCHHNIIQLLKRKISRKGTNDIVICWRIIIPDIDSSTANAFILECVKESFFINNSASTNIDDISGSLHFTNRLCTNQSVSFSCKWKSNNNSICHIKKL